MKLAGLLLFGVLIFISYSNPFIADDYTHIINTTLMESLPGLSDFFGPGYIGSQPTWSYRPLIYITYYFDKSLWGITPGPMRVMNGLLHLLNVALVIQIAKQRFYQIEDSQKNQLGASLLIFVALFHPVFWHNILYVSARSTLMAATFTLASIVLYRLESYWRWSFLAFIVLGLYVKETTILALPLTILFNLERAKADFSRNKKLLLPVSVILLFWAGLFIYKRPWVFTSIIGFFKGSRDSFHHQLFPYIKLQVSMSLIYFKNLFLTLWDWSYYYFLSFEKDNGLGRLFLSLTIHLGILSGAFWFFRNKRLKTIGLLIFAIYLTISPEFFFPRELVGIDQRIYLTGLFSLLLIPCVIKILSDKKGVLAFGLYLVSLIILSGFSSYKRIATYQSIERMMEQSLSVEPRNVLAHALLGQKQFENNNFNQAITHFEKALELYETEGRFSRWYTREKQKVYHQLVTIYLATGKIEAARELLGRCIKMKISEGRCYLLGSKFHNLTGNPQKALELAMALNSDSALVKREKLFAYLKLKNFDKFKELLPAAEKQTPFDLSLIKLKAGYLYETKKMKELDLYLKKVELEYGQTDAIYQRLGRQLRKAYLN